MVAAQKKCRHYFLWTILGSIANLPSTAQERCNSDLHVYKSSDKVHYCGLRDYDPALIFQHKFWAVFRQPFLKIRRSNDHWIIFNKSFYPWKNCKIWNEIFVIYDDMMRSRFATKDSSTTSEGPFIKYVKFQHIKWDGLG